MGKCAGQTIIIHIFTHVDSFCAAAKCVDMFRVHYNYDDEAHICAAICYVSEQFGYKLSTELQLKGERNSAMMMMKHKYLLPFVMFSCV